MKYGIRQGKTEQRARSLRGNARDSHSESRVQIPWPANLVEVFSGFLNLKIAKKLVIFKTKCLVGPHIPVLLIQFNVYCLQSSVNIVVKMVNF